MGNFLPKISIQIVSRYVPAENKSGPFTYLFDIMRYLHRIGCHLELNILDPWFQVRNIPGAVQEMANVVIMPALPEANQRQFSIKTLFRPIYTRLPNSVLHPVRKAFYDLQGKPLPGIHPHDAPATQEEIAFIAERMTAFRPDVLITNHTCLGNTFEMKTFENASILKIILTHHIESQRTHDFNRARLSSRDSLWNREYEANLLQHADVLLAIQKEDATVLKEMAPQCEVLYAPMSATYHPHEPAEQVAGRCLFVGSDIDHNVHGMTWFLHEVWPLVLQQHSQATLHVCGTVCSKIDHTFPKVQLLGRVEQIETEYAATEVCLIPLVVGSGLKIKLVEALSHGRACVATSVGVQGVQELRGKAVLVADTPYDFARDVISVLANADQRCKMEEEARRYVIEKLLPEKTYQPFIKRIYEHLTQLVR
ncbi:glycosyl transferase group 1 [Candidatus Vecturithrix granuli]|uniref:Glycosyl transferase group 1 n=1 Tax=Vecturithrix granuli TaxID=1499967 RepID=A0A0S6W6P1_VECG1|nr:glycosyl transferase group 1 [Candidatus Vecturithrix granuli]